MQFRKVLVLAAHPDDEMGCAGTLGLLADQDADIDLVTFSACLDLNKPALLEEWREAVALFGICEPRLLNLPNRSLYEHRRTILDVLSGYTGYDLVLTPATWDAHQDHSTVTQEAIRVFKRTTVLGYELPLNAVGASHLTTYVRLPNPGVKLAHAACYRSQAHKPYMDPRYIEGLARTRGVQCGAEFAEALETIRWIM